MVGVAPLPSRIRSSAAESWSAQPRSLRSFSQASVPGPQTITARNARTAAKAARKVMYPTSRKPLMCSWSGSNR
mgnify:CR=1 FL=1